MYSVVMMMALSGTPVTVDRCHRCHGCWGCYGCWGCHGCWGCWGGWGCYGCHHWGGYYGGYWGGGWGWGGYGGFSYPYYGGLVYRTTPAATVIARQQQDNTATVVVTLPASAKLTINGWTSKNTSETRRFRSPPLEKGRDYYYTVRAEMVRDGQTITQTREVAVRAGQETRVPLDFASTAVTQNSQSQADR